MQEIYLKRFWFEFSKDELKDFFLNSPILFKYNNVYEVVSYLWKLWVEYSIKEIRQLKKKIWLPYTKKGRFCAFNYKQANNLLEREFFIEN